VTVPRSGWWLLEQMLQRVTSAQRDLVPVAVTTERIDGSPLPAELKRLLRSYAGAASALDDASHYSVLPVACADAPQVLDARTGGQPIRLAAVADNTQMMDEDRTTFVPVRDGDVDDRPECYTCRREKGGGWVAEGQGYTFDSILPWRWAFPFMEAAYPSGDELPDFDWSGTVEELAALLDQALGVPRSEPFQVDEMVGNISEAGAWIAFCDEDGGYALCMGGAAEAVTRIEEALYDAEARGTRVKRR
jgi:hypothetical protein